MNIPKHTVCISLGLDMSGEFKNVVSNEHTIAYQSIRFVYHVQTILFSVSWINNALCCRVVIWPNIGHGLIICVCMSWVYLNAGSIVVVQFAVRDPSFVGPVSNVKPKSVAGVLLAIL